jgi:Caspase domain
MTASGCGIRRLCLIAILLLATWLAAMAPAMADRRVALVIGNSQYRHATALNAAAGDARVLAAALQAAGFTLSGGAALFDLDKASLDRAVQQFGRDIADADVALVYYAGHAIQLRGSDFLVPVDAAPTTEADVDFQMLHIGLLLHQMEGSAKRLNLVVLDACHANPFEGRGLDGIEPGLAAIHAPENTLVAYAAQPDTAVPDTSDANNLFAMSLAETIQRPRLDLFDVFNEAGLEVKRRTNGAQQPFVAFTPIGGHFVFVTTPPPVVAAAPVTSAPKALGGAGERVVLYDEDPSDPKGKNYEGSVIWHTEQTKASGAQKADRMVRGDIEIPGRNLKLVFTLRRNSDPALPASHTGELTFTVPPGFPSRGIATVPGILMKTKEDVRGTPLAGLAVKVTDDMFLVGLSNVDADRQRNIQLLKEREWFDIPLVYTNQRRAILAIAKGVTGERAFADAFAAWDRNP